MSKKIVALQGKIFYVELESMLGSTNYGWCVKTLPAGLIFMGEEKIPVAPGIAPVKQQFYFGVVSAENANVEIEFELVCGSDLTKIGDEYKPEVTIVGSNSEDFVPYSENDAVSNAVRNSAVRGNINLKYGYPCDNVPILKYGYPGGLQDAALKYGYPCSTQNIVVKYGYPCGSQDAAVKYGYVCRGTGSARLPTDNMCLGSYDGL